MAERWGGQNDKGYEKCVKTLCDSPENDSRYRCLLHLSSPFCPPSFCPSPSSSLRFTLGKNCKKTGGQNDGGQNDKGYEKCVKTLCDFSENDSRYECLLHLSSSFCPSPSSFLRFTLGGNRKKTGGHKGNTERHSERSKSIFVGAQEGFESDVTAIEIHPLDAC